MSVQITIRNVPDEVRDRLAARAASAGQSMQEFLRGELVLLAERPSIEDWLRGVRRRKGLAPRELGAEVLLEHQDADRA